DYEVLRIVMCITFLTFHDLPYDDQKVAQKSRTLYLPLPSHRRHDDAFATGRRSSHTSVISPSIAPSLCSTAMDSRRVRPIHLCILLSSVLQRQNRRVMSVDFAPRSRASRQPEGARGLRSS